MIVVRRRFKGIPYCQKWFARKGRVLDAFKAVAYFQFLGRRPPPLFIRRPFTTIHIDLQRDPEKIQADMHSNVRYEIRRAEKEGLRWEIGVDAVDFVSSYGAFAAEKGIRAVGRGRLLSLGDALVLTRTTRDGITLAQHAYVVDRRESRARFLYSSSARFNSSNTALVARANRWCHWRDMLYLRKVGFSTYDLGGIAQRSTDAAGINSFKIRFGGTILREDHWVSPLYFLASLAGAR